MTLKFRHTIIFHVIGPILMIGFVVAGVICGCGRDVDSRLYVADSLMEEHPDSALIILDAYKLPAGASAYNRALYGLMLTHARYKNFIDETDDSLISVSADYFLDHGDKEMAARSLFLKGIIELNAERYGGAAISFSKGLDMAKDVKAYMWVGQCAHGLDLLYIQLIDGSAQVNFAKQAYEAFLKTGDKGWVEYSQLEMARAYNNNAQYEKSVELLNDLIENKDIAQDSLMLSHSLRLKGLALFSLDEFKESIECYRKAYEINTNVLTSADRNNIQMIYAFTQDSLSINGSLFWCLNNEENESDNAFVILANSGKYKEAYESLEKYKNRQDSLIARVLRNNVSECINRYDASMASLNNQKVKNEKLTYGIIILVCIVLGLFIIWRSRERIHSEKNIRLKAEADLESLRSDMQAQLEKAENDIGQEIFSENNELIRLIRQKYSVVNTFCDDYYQGLYSKREKDRVLIEVNNIIKDFTERSSLLKISEFIDDNTNGLYSSFKTDFINLPDWARSLFLYLLLGFSNRTISVMFGQDISAVYNKKSRLKAKIIDSDVPKKKDYLKFF